jgi:hypothetical protein
MLHTTTVHEQLISGRNPLCCKIKPTYLENRCLAHGGEFQSSQVLGAVTQFRLRLQLWFQRQKLCHPYILITPPAHVAVHSRWQPTYDLTHFAVIWGGAGFESETSAVD